MNTKSEPLDRLKYHVTGAIERGEKEAITAKSNVWKSAENDFFKITVEEVNPKKFIATFWEKEMEHEVDRKVYEFETPSGAIGKAFDLLVETTIND